MNKLICIPVLCFFLLQCKTKQRQEPPAQQPVPEALQDNKSSYEILSKRGSGNVVEELYAESSSKRPELKSLDEEIEKIKSGGHEPFSAFNSFNSKNEEYYSMAEQHGNQIKDSALKLQVQQMIRQSLENYKDRTSRHQNLISQTTQQTAKLDDLYAALKLIITIPVMEKYQKDNLPSQVSMEAYLRQVNQAIKRTDSLSKK